MLRTLSLLAAGTLLAATAFAAPATCSGAKYLDAATGTCKPCGSRTAKTCSSAAVATSCVSRYYLTADGRCVANGQCPTSTFANQSNGKCDKCFLPTYKTCSNGKSYSATSCMNNTCLPATGGRCLPFANIKNTQYCTPAGKIETCPGEGAQTCTVTGTTLSCKAPYFFTAGTSSPASGDAAGTFTLSKRISITANPVTTSGPCVLEANCPSGTFGNTATRTCSPCGEGASRCNIDGATTCFSGYFLSEKQCVKTCPSGKKGLNGVCVDESYCPFGIYEPFTKTCVDACSPFYTQNDGLAVPAEYPSSDGKICLACSEHALECDQATGLAVSCLNGYFLLDGQCYNSCPDGYSGNGGKCIEEQSYCSVGGADTPLQYQYTGCVSLPTLAKYDLRPVMEEVESVEMCKAVCESYGGAAHAGIAMTILPMTGLDMGMCYCILNSSDVTAFGDVASEAVDDSKCDLDASLYRTYGILC